MNGDRIIHGAKGEARRLHNWPSEGQNRAAKRHLSRTEAIALLAFAAGLLLGLVL